MRLDDILEGDLAFLYMERYLDEGTKTYSPFASISEAEYQYQPRSHEKSFNLIDVVVPKSTVSVFLATPQKEILEFYINDEEVHFLVHPETWKNKNVQGIERLHRFLLALEIEVAPTASTRTVLTVKPFKNVPSHFIKLHYPKKISRFNRRLRFINIRNSIEVTKDISQINFHKFAYLPDVIGIANGFDNNSWGFIIREKKPRPFFEKRFLIPFFALYGEDLNDKNSIPLLVQMINRFKVDPKQFLVEQIMTPVLECWCKVVRERGILLECHAQNILLEVDDNFYPTRIVHRDFDVWIDAKRRKQNGLESPFVGGVIEVDTPYSQKEHYSLIYDYFMGHELFDYLLDVLIRSFNIEEAWVQNKIKETFHLNFPDADFFFPKDTTYYFSNEILPDNEFKLVNTKEAPKWR